MEPASSLESVFNHLALPPKLPGKNDSHIERIEKHIVSRLIDAVVTLKGLLKGEYSEAWDTVLHSLEVCRDINQRGVLETTSLLNGLKEVRRNDGGNVIIHVAEQNAGLIIRGDGEDNVIFEAFEASPASKSVMNAENALQWDFPGSAVSISFAEFLDSSFQENLAEFLEQASTESIKRFAAHTKKAGVSVVECRDSVDPSLITQMFMALLEAIGSRVYPPMIRKSVRDDVCWEDAELPWRRCPYWLVLRVSVQRILYLHLGYEIGRAQYKFLISTLLSRLLVDSLGSLSLESCAFLKAKLCRRLSKLEIEKSDARKPFIDAYLQTFTATQAFFQQTIQKAEDHINLSWGTFKSKILRPVPQLPLRADSRDLQLSLPQSHRYLKQILQSPSAPNSKPYSLGSDLDFLRSDDVRMATGAVRTFAERYYSFADREVNIESLNETLPTHITLEEHCVELGNKIIGYLNAVGRAYDTSPVEESGLILNIFTLWVLMDRCAIRVFPLLKEYHPGFFPDLLDVLQLPRLQDMCRLQEIQLYLRDRCAQSQPETIFADPSEDCFAVRYFDQSTDSSKLRNRQQLIQAASDNARSSKEREWKDMTRKHESMTQDIFLNACTEKKHSDGSHDIRGCKHCFLVRSRRRLRIFVHEAFLPSNDSTDNTVQRKAIVFELGVPKAFASYRDVTWKIFKTFGAPKSTSISSPPETLLKDYNQFARFNFSDSPEFTLASTKKSFLDTHFKGYRLPITLDGVLFPLGLHFSYYDTQSNIWSETLISSKTHVPQCGISIPPANPFSFINKSQKFAPGAYGPSSYEVIASQTKCPSKLTVHEFMAYQNLFSGKATRWLKMLVELGSSNLNFSAEATMLLFCQLALQAGPTNGDGSSRLIHMVFHDENFCRKLAKQIDERIDIIASNPREAYCMEILVTLALRLYELGCSGMIEEGATLLEKIRTVTLRWTALLRTEIRDETKADTAETATGYAFLAALLCRRTFVTSVGGASPWNAKAVKAFVEASLALQENLVGDAGKLAETPRNMLIRDLKMVYRMRKMIRNSIRLHGASFVAAFQTVWPDSNDDPRTYPSWRFLSGDGDGWVVSTVNATKHTVQQTVHYHILEGHFLVNGKPLGKLPMKIRNTEILRELFGNQHLLCFPSALPGMTYVLDVAPDGHEIHLGFQGNRLSVKARVRKTVLQLVERIIFGHSRLDLPYDLIQHCFHWLDLTSGLLEIRRQSHPWKHIRKGNWMLNVHTRMAHRRSVLLVDPHSKLFQDISGIFWGFEDQNMLTVFQPLSRNLTVELKHLDLSFTVNKKYLLESPELRSVIDPNQDAGTLYGLQSKIVLRDSFNWMQRSIIIPIGKYTHQRNGIHVSVQVVGGGSYGRYMIDNVVGRLQCPSEPLLLYHKALLHAFTSFIIPDPLTGLTGTESAMHCLQSGSCQPWNPIHPEHITILTSIAQLTPKRNYYPKHLNMQQTVRWDPQLTTAIQFDGYRPVIEALIAKSEKLSTFTLNKVDVQVPTSDDNPYLRQRSQYRRSLYERGSSLIKEKPSPQQYKARDRLVISKGAFDVYQSVRLVRERPSRISTTRDLARKLSFWPIIQGYSQPFKKPILSDRLQVDIALEWGGLVNLCRNSDSNKLIFQLSVIAFGKGIDMEIIRTLIAFSILESLKGIDLPLLSSSFQNFNSRESPTTDSIAELIEGCHLPYAAVSHGGGHKALLTAAEKKEIEVARNDHEDQCRIDRYSFANLLLDQWPCKELTVDKIPVFTTLDTHKAMDAIRPEWTRLFCNFKLSQHITNVQDVLNAHQGGLNDIRPPDHQQNHVYPESLRYGPVIPTLVHDLLRKDVPCLSLVSHPDASNTSLNMGENDNTVIQKFSNSISARNLEAPRTQPSYQDIDELETIVDKLADTESHLRKQYGDDLKQSLEALRLVKDTSELENIPFSFDNLRSEIPKARKVVHDQFQNITKALTVGDSRLPWLEAGTLWPCITPVILLECLRSTSDHNFGRNMKEAIISYAISITTLQRLLRMYDAYFKRDSRKLREEQRNTGHCNWNPSDYPDWLLLEIDANILIRNEQVDVALSTISPDSKYNSVLQMNMGQGKTSCIMPMVAAVLANGQRLARLTVPLALLFQTGQILQSRLGGLLGREIKHVPFSRGTPIDPHTVETYRTIHQDMLESSGIVLALPEHILSFKLSGLQCLSDSRLQQAALMINVQSWLTGICRDVLDECDFTLAVKTQLVYPSGSQLVVDGHPSRWEVAQALLGLAEAHLWNLQAEFPHSIEIVKRTSVGFPVFHFLRRDIEDALTTRLTRDICKGTTSILPLNKCTVDDLNSIRIFISQENVNPEVIKKVSKLFSGRRTPMKNLFLLRGLLVDGILLLCLKKRWNVQYGLNPNRDPVAVPFHAKGVPSERSEWGHPDVAILLTCLAFYYSGLEIPQFQQALSRVLKSDDPSSEYDRWTHNSVTLPEPLRHWNVINADDGGQVMGIWHHLRFSVIVIDYYLNRLVFPLYARQFRIKLQASGWDIPLFSAKRELPSVDADGAPHSVTTGFSGTNDNRRMLPLTIRQDDLPGLLHTNAEVLTYLLQARNRGYVIAANPAGKHLSELELLKKLETMGIRILIDVGAHILEMGNKALVEAWLGIEYQVPAAVYFGDDNKAWVHYRNKSADVPLLASPFADNLEKCLVYIDEAHTRGTDLKLPDCARGALTLGMNQTKDHTVQAAMRLRQLGSTQSITFVSPPEVHQCILDLRGKEYEDNVDSADVIYWLLEQTCRSNEELQQLYFAQGIDFCHRTQAAWDNSNFLTDSKHRATLLEVLQQPEHQSLEELYKPKTNSTQATDIISLSPKLNTFSKELNQRRLATNADGNVIAHNSALEEVEQEKEVALVVEEEREIQKPVHFKARGFPGIDPAILHFAKTGELLSSAGYEQVATALKRTELGLKYKISITDPHRPLYVSIEFMRTVKTTSNMPNDNFLRPVNWILWSPETESALIIIPEEAEGLVPVLRAANPPRVHLLTYAAPVTKRMLHFNNLDYYSLPCLPKSWKPPTWLTTELSLFAGRLYFEFSEYEDLIKRFCTEGAKAGAKKANKMAETESLRTFLQEWLSIVRKGQDFTHTPMGHICESRHLHSTHPFFATNTDIGNLDVGKDDQQTTGTICTTGGGGNDDGDGDGDDESDEEALGMEQVEEDPNVEDEQEHLA